MIGIMADSHDNLANVRAAAELFKRAGCRLVIHAGDIIAPFSARALEAADCPVKAVFGNCDGEREGLRRAFSGFGSIQQAPLEFRRGGLAFLVRHLDGGLEELRRDRKPDVLVFGHSHRPEIRTVENTLLVNPGEAGGWVHGKSTAALLNEETKTAEIVPL